MARAAIDFAAAGGVDLDRLERSLDLDGQRVGDGRYRVVGGDHVHWVDLYTTTIPRRGRGVREARGSAAGL